MTIQPYRRVALVLFLLLFLCGCSQAYLPQRIDTDTSVADAVLLDVPPRSQYPGFPTGCESVTAVMALNYVGVPVTVDTFVDTFLPCDSRFYEKDGLQYGPDPYAVFVGNPRSAQSYGCMAPVIEQALLSCVGKQREVRNVTGTPLSELCKTYIDRGVPVILWATMEMRPVGSGGIWFLEDGRQFIWPSGEHCLLLVGYSDDEYFFNDPRHGETVAYAKKATESCYAALGRQALVVTENPQ